MDENLKYFKLSGAGIEANVVVACKPDEVERLREKCADYTLEECECPKGAQIISAEPPIPDPVMLEYHNIAAEYGQYLGKKCTVYDGPNCGRCANRFRYSDYCSTHFHSTKPCYRFKLEK